MGNTKTLFILRHAKSSWDDASKSDFDRPLNNRGVKDANIMAKELADKLSKLDLILASSANRAASTAQIFAHTLNFPEGKLRFDDSIYTAHEGDIENIVKELPDDHTQVLIVGHNPTLTYFANRYYPEHIGNMPTAGIVMLEFNANSWSKVSKENLASYFFDFPKNHK
ncbi:MAG: histidine phosphatase family protein [Perlabentimonas sp.]